MWCCLQSICNNLLVCPITYPPNRDKYQVHFAQDLSCLNYQLKRKHMQFNLLGTCQAKLSDGLHSPTAYNLSIQRLKHFGCVLLSISKSKE